MSYDQFVANSWMGGQGETDLAVATLGLVGESGEVAEKIKKQLRGDPAHNPENWEDQQTRNKEVIKELGDVVFYVAWLAAYHGATLGDVIDANMEKLTKRYSDNGTLRGDGDNR